MPPRTIFIEKNINAFFQFDPGIKKKNTEPKLKYQTK